jgi:signal transduction histidine kinase/ActR/RegA family two-component response regulator
MYRYRNLPIHHKLKFIVLLTCGSLVMLMTIFFMADKYFSFRRNMVANITALAEVIGINSTAALTFDDPKTGKEILSAISAEPHVVAACIFRPNGNILASYPPHPDGKKHLDAVVKKLMARSKKNDDITAPVQTFSFKQFTFAKPVLLNHKQIGFIGIRANLDQLYSRLAIYAVMVVGVMVVLVIMAQMITARLHRTISDPLLALVSTMNRVTADKNYGLRVKKQSYGELSDLIDRFNDMLSQIQQRDQQLERHRDLLEEQIAQRTHELIRSHEKLKQEKEERKQMQDQLARAHQMEAIGTLVAGVAHDLNNILSGIVSYPDLMLIRLPHDSDMRKPLTTIQKSGQKAVAIVQDLLTLARRGVTTSEVVNLKETIEDYLESPEHANLITFHPGVRIIKNIAPDLMHIAGSPVHLSKTVMNLISNAAEAITGEGTVSITLHNQYIDMPVRGYDDIQQGDYVVLKIRDTGHGIAANDLQHIFEPFYTKKKMGRSGTGLGMAVVWGTVKDHQGYINVESCENEGSTFTLYFPVTRRKHRAQEPVQISDYMGAGQTILVVDDIKEQREIASDILESLQYNVTTVDSGEAALEHLEKHQADLLLLDMIMDPGIDGLETYERIVAANGKQRAVIASGYSESERVKKALELGVGKYLNKPYTIENLARTIYLELHGIDDMDN